MYLSHLLINVGDNPDRPRPEDLTSLPWPDLSMVEGFEKSKVVPVLTSRGCPYNCKFCSVTSKETRNKIAGYITTQVKQAKKEEEKAAA